MTAMTARFAAHDRVLRTAMTALRAMTRIIPSLMPRSGEVILSLLES